MNIDEILYGKKWKRIYCPNCESAYMKLIGDKVAECTVCKATKALK